MNDKHKKFHRNKIQFKALQTTSTQQEIKFFFHTGFLYKLCQNAQAYWKHYMGCGSGNEN